MLLLSRAFFENSHFQRDHQRLSLQDLAAKAGLLHQDSSGVYSLLAMGVLAQAQLEQRLRRFLTDAGAVEIRLALLQDKALWEATGREADYEGELLTVRTRTGQSFALSATAEEHITQVAKSLFQGRQVDQWAFQIGTKWRDELRCRAGLVRAREFTMMDAYRFATDLEQVERTHVEARAAILGFFNSLGLACEVVAADCGAIGGLASEEFQVASELGRKGEALEVAHSFVLGDRYSKALGLLDHQRQAVQMGCQGVGLSRTLMALLEHRRDELGFWGDDAFSIVDTSVVVLNQHKDGVLEHALELARFLETQGKSVVVDDRQERAGRKLSDAELMGVRRRIVVSDRTLTSGLYEVTARRTGEQQTLEREQL